MLISNFMLFAMIFDISFFFFQICQDDCHFRKSLSRYILNVSNESIDVIKFIPVDGNLSVL